MSDFTYEQNPTSTPLETYEWDNTWLDHASNAEVPHALYIGDSISCGTRRIATSCADGKMLFDGFGTSKALDNPFFKDAIRLFAAQQCRSDVVLFNNGLHGFHLDDDTDYRRYYFEMVEFLCSTFKGKPIYIVLTTSVADEEREGRVLLRNRVAREAAEKFNLAIIDLYSVSVNNSEHRSSDGVHFDSDGYRFFAEEIVKTILN